MDVKLTLTGNDLAIAEQGIGHLVNFWKKQGRSKWSRQRRAEAEAVLTKLNEIMNHAYPYPHGCEEPLDYGDEPIMRPDLRVIGKTRRRAIQGEKT